MASARKVAAYLDIKQTITQQYLSLKDNYKTEVDYAGLANVFEMLKHLDELAYEFHVYKSYLETTKKKITQAEKDEIAEVEKLIKQLEDDTSLSYLTENASRLAIVRRELFENAKEGGRLLQGFEIRPLSPNSAPASATTTPSTALTPSKRATTTNGSFARDKTKPHSSVTAFPSVRFMKWNKRAAQIVFEASNIEPPVTKDKLNYIREHFEEELHHHTREDFARYLLLHYIDGESYGFREAFDEAYTKIDHPNLEKRAHLLLKELNTNKPEGTPVVPEYAVRCAITLREIFQNTYGKITEPPENYQ
ncbi:hypothetical protein Cantr_07815 [Candida viswanathii]|uniref:Uncharacterized protein n=1 Tax=Candida viswanathii TaxID=5486 RepID=A0A367Y0N1_9ASCO|nr:hypothetical protein Cantr_07815 [Candida viswanathii]